MTAITIDQFAISMLFIGTIGLSIWAITHSVKNSGKSRR